MMISWYIILSGFGSMLMFIWMLIRLELLQFIRGALMPPLKEHTYPGGGDPVKEHWLYNSMKYLVRDKRIQLPAVFVDLDLLEQNARTLASIAKAAGKTIRIPTKSVRCPDLIKRIMAVDPDVFKGLMCFSVQEAALLAEEGFDDFVMAYPVCQYADIKAAVDLKHKGKKIILCVSGAGHVGKLDFMLQEAGIGEDERMPVCVDLDMSYRIGPFHLGPHRSEIWTVQKFETMTKMLKTSRHLEFAALLGYEGHVAGLPDRNPHESYFKAFLINWLKPRFYDNASRLRQDIARFCRDKNIRYEFFNGGGTGNIAQACTDPALTEISAGSGFLQSRLFDYYKDNQCAPAICFALQSTRMNLKYMVMQGGGFIASGSVSPDKCPVPFGNPMRIENFPDEGYGEVQTPFQPVARTGIEGGPVFGGPVLFRPAKAGEIAERFNEYHLKRGYDIVGTCKTYRGLGRAFH